MVEPVIFIQESYMFDSPSHSLPSSIQETLILCALRTGESVTIEQVINLLPELTWNEVFGAVDRLSRKGAISLRRRGFTYQLNLARLAVAS